MKDTAAACALSTTRGSSTDHTAWTSHTAAVSTWNNKPPSKHTHTHSQPSQITPPRNPQSYNYELPLCNALIWYMGWQRLTLQWWPKTRWLMNTHVSIVTITNKLRPKLPSLKMQFAHKATDISVDCLYVCSWWNDLTDAALTERMKAFQCAYTPAVEDVSEVRCTAAAPGAWQSRGNYEEEDEEEGQPAVTCHRLAQHPDLLAAAHLGTTGWGGWAMWTGLWATRTFNTETIINCALARPPADQKFSGQVRQEDSLNYV